jgi:MFS family permease
MMLIISTKVTDRLTIIWLSLSLIIGILVSGLSWLLTITVNSIGLQEAENVTIVVWLIMVYGLCAQVSTFLTGYIIDLINIHDNKSHSELSLSFGSHDKHETTESLTTDEPSYTSKNKKRIIISVGLCIVIYIIFLLIGFLVTYFSVNEQ